MKKLIFLSFALVAFLSMQKAEAQTVNPNNVPTIETNITCDTLVSPNLFYVSITIVDNKGAGKAGIEKTESSVLIPILKKAGVDTSKDLAVTNFSSNYNKKGNDVVAQKSYQLKLTSIAKFNEISNKLTAANIGNVYIASATVSNADQIVNELKVRAMKQSKIEAEILTAAIGCRCGSALKISYYGRNNYGFAEGVMLARASKAMDANNNEEPESVDVYKKIKLSSSVNVSYEIINK